MIILSIVFAKQQTALVFSESNSNNPILQQEQGYARGYLWIVV
jgi:hypothetical protein